MGETTKPRNYAFTYILATINKPKEPIKNPPPPTTGVKKYYPSLGI